nr:hypothetical protein [Candidatus Freyrarchaeum guaymaensis]
MIEWFFRLISRYDVYGALIIVLLSALLGSLASVALRKIGYLTPLAAATITLVTTLSLGGFTVVLYLKYLRKVKR